MREWDGILCDSCHRKFDDRDDWNESCSPGFHRYHQACCPTCKRAEKHIQRSAS